MTSQHPTRAAHARPSRTPRVAALAALAMGATLWGAGCGANGDLQYAIGRYEVGHYRTTEASCAELSSKVDSMSDEARVRYQVYCGLAHYRLGHMHEASALLTEGNASYLEGRLGWLKPGVVDELLKALDELERAPTGDAGVDAVADGAAFTRR